MSTGTKYQLKNEHISIEVSSFGAELKSLKRQSDSREYMWDARPEFWKRTSPVLFPIVGGLHEGKYHYEGQEYAMSQHGFARDMEFTLTEQTQESLKFELNDTAETYAQYPFHFKLEITYKIVDNHLKITWKVDNTNDHKMYFSIGGHPAFLCPIQEETKQTEYTLHFDTADKIVSSMLGEGGLLTNEKKTYALNNGVLAVTKDLFDNDALVVEGNQAHEVSLAYGEEKPYLTVRFEAPLFGIWSPPKKEAPFICIEPWYGRCDKADYTGSLENREWGNVLEAGKSFEVSYEVTVEE